MTLLQQLAVMTAYYEGRIYGLESARDMPQARLCWLMSQGIGNDQIEVALDENTLQIQARLVLMDGDIRLLSLHGAFTGHGLLTAPPYGEATAVAREVGRISGKVGPS